MSLSDWVQNGWLTKQQSSAEEIRNLLGIADRDLRECRLKELSADWRFAIAYNAGLQAATAALAAAGYRAAHESHHHRVIQSLEFTIGADPGLIRQFDAFRKKRNISSYDLSGAISDREVQGMASLAKTLRTGVERWIRAKHPELL